MNILEARKLNCLSHWYPLIEKVVPTPKTVIVKTDANLIEMLDNHVPDGLGALLEGLNKAGETLGYPFFLRTGQTSGKHDWINTCHINSQAHIPSHIAALVEYSEMVDLCGLPWDVWVAREMLPVKPIGHAFKGMPVVREFRVFVSDGKIKCVHPYWPKDCLEEAMAGCDPKSEEWESQYRSISSFKSMDEEQVVMMFASLAGVAVGGEWSIDLLDTEKGWVVTDMALAAMSYHMPGCSNAKED